MDFDTAMGRVIGSRAKLKGLQQGELADRAGMAANTLSRFIRHGGNTATLVKIADALGIHTSVLMKDAEDIMKSEVTE